MKVSLISTKKNGATRKVIATPKAEAIQLMVEVHDFVVLVKRNTLITLAIEQHAGTKKFFFRAHTLDHPEGILLVTRRNKRRPRLLKTIDMALEIFKDLTGINVFSHEGKVSAGILQIPFSRPFTVIELDPEK